jgi:NAD-reducing hydrogenase large subunit
MPQRIVIDPVTRIEGHAKITIHLDDAGQVTDAHFHVTEFRGFERMYEGRPIWEMPAITSRICGICPVSHLIASAKAGDRILAVTVPPAAEKLRRLVNLAQIIQSHALSFFYLSAPDLMLGMESNPASRNLFGLIAAEPELARGGIRLRQFGQQIIAALGGQRIHPAWAVPGGVRSSLTDTDRAQICERIPEARTTAQTALERFKRLRRDFKKEMEVFGNFPTMFLGIVGADGCWEHYDGRIRMVDSAGKIIVEGLDPNRYREVLGEATESSSYLKSPYYKPFGYPEGIYRVGPLARLNICTRMGTPLADQELAEWRSGTQGAVTSSFLYHQARLIEILSAIEHIEQMLGDADLSSDQLCARAGINQREGIGCSEAPRGTLFHHYNVDADGRIEKVNLLIATGQNNLAMNQTVAQIARNYIKGSEISEGLLNRVEAGIRAFDPCLSCSTHSAGLMPLHVQLIGPGGDVLREVWRN